MSTDDPAEIEGLRAAGKAVAAVLRETRRHVRPGVTTTELDEVAERILRAHGARSAPAPRLRLPRHDLHLVDDEAVHGIPGPRRLREGQLVKLDVTAELDGFFADAAVSVPVGRCKPRVSAARGRRAGRARRGARRRPAGMTNAIGAIVEAAVERRGARVCASSPATASAARSTRAPPSRTSPTTTTSSR